MPTIISGFWANLDWDQWVYGLVAGFLGGGSGAVVSGFVVSVRDPQHYNFASSDFYILVFSIFLANGLLNFFSYLHQNPLPAHKTVTKMEQTEVVDSKPTVTTTTTIEKTEITPIVPPPKKDG